MDICAIRAHEKVSDSELLNDLEHGHGLTEAAISDRTRAAYDYEFGRLALWAERHKLASLPTTSAIAATYLAHLCKPGTLSVVRAAIKHDHSCGTERTRGMRKSLSALNRLSTTNGGLAAATSLRSWSSFGSGSSRKPSDYHDRF